MITILIYINQILSVSQHRQSFTLNSILISSTQIVQDKEWNQNTYVSELRGGLQNFLFFILLKSVENSYLRAFFFFYPKKKTERMYHIIIYCPKTLHLSSATHILPVVIACGCRYKLTCTWVIEEPKGISDLYRATQSVCSG